MIEKIKRLGSDTAVYGISTILGRFLTFFLTPFYTHLLRPDDLGIVATMYAYIAFLNVVYGHGMESAFMKYVSTMEIGTRKQNFTIPLLSVGAVSVVLSGVAIGLRQPLADLTSLPERYASLVPYSAGILLLDALAIVPFAELRMVRRARTFAAIKLTGIVVNVACNLVFLLHFHAGVEGIFLSNIVSNGVVLLLLIPVVVRNWDSSPCVELYRALLRFGLPYVPAGLAAMMIQVINRPILEALRGPAAVGVFQANYRLGIFMMLLVAMFDFAWRPFFLTHAADPDAKPLFARIFTYVILVFTMVFLALSFFLGDIVRAPIFAGRTLIAAPYWPGLEIVPVILLAYLFLGVYNNLVAGIYIEKKTSYLPAVTIGGAVVNVAANYALIPPFGLMGAGLATLASYIVMAVSIYLVVQRVYPVRYEWGRVAKIAVSAIVVFLPFVIFPQEVSGIGVKAGLLGGFVVLMIVFRFFTRGELQGVRALVRRDRNSPSKSGDHH